MKTLELNQMVLVDGGNGCTNVENGLNAASMITWAAGVFFVATTGGLALFVIGGLIVTASYVNCE
jgi:hypothetical protein